MSSRKQSSNKPYWKRYRKGGPGTVIRYGFDEEGNPVLDENGQQLYRVEGNRAMRRLQASLYKRGLK